MATGNTAAFAQSNKLGEALYQDGSGNVLTGAVASLDGSGDEGSLHFSLLHRDFHLECLAAAHDLDRNRIAGFLAFELLLCG